MAGLFFCDRVERMDSQMFISTARAQVIAARDAHAARRLQQVALMSLALLSLVAFALGKAG
jgi:hypothetical protein